jgi:hypothetical protein
MSAKRSMIRWSVGALGALATLAVATAAVAKDDKKKKDEKAAAPEPKGGLMEEGGKDPAQTETMDEDGQFIPGRKKKAAAARHAGGGAEGEEGEAESSHEGGDERAEAKAPEPEKEKEKPVKARKTVGILAEALIGFGKAPVPGPLNTTAGGDGTTGPATTYGFLLGGHYDVTTDFRLMLRVPWTTGTIQVLGKDHATNALGAPELAGRYRLTDPGNTEWAVRLAVGVPIAQGNPDFTDVQDATGLEQGRLQRVADAAAGWHDPELYAPKRLPISPALLVSHRDGKLRLSGELKAVAMPKISGQIKSAAAGASGGNFTMSSFAFTALLGGTVSYEVLEHKHLALAAWATYTASPAIDYSSTASSPSPFQLVLEPKILAQFGRVVPSVGFLIPAGGQLGGQIFGLRIHVDVVF